MIPLTPTSYRLDPGKKTCRDVTAVTISVATLLCFLFFKLLRRILFLHAPLAIRGCVWCLVTFNFVDNGLLKFLVCWPSIVGLTDSLELYLTSSGLLVLLLVTSACSGTLVTISAIVHWRLSHDEAVFFGYHASQFAILGCLSVAWIQANSRVDCQADVHGDERVTELGRLSDTVTYPKPMVPSWHEGGLRFVHIDLFSRIIPERWLFEGFVYKAQYMILLVFVGIELIEWAVSFQLPQWLGFPSMVDLWCLLYGGLTGWVWMRYFHFYAAVRSRGDHSNTFEFATVFFPFAVYSFVSPVFNRIYSTASKVTIFQLDPQKPVPRANSAPVLPLAAADIRTSGLTMEQRSLRQKGMEVLKLHIANPVKLSTNHAVESRACTNEMTPGEDDES